MLWNAILIAWIPAKKIHQAERKRERRGADDCDASSVLLPGATEKIDGGPRAVHTRPRQRGACTKARREVDACSRQRSAPLAGKGLGSAYRPGASARVGALRRRPKPGQRGSHGKAHHRW